MLDINKFHSSKLATNISAAVMLPDNYNSVLDTYDTIYVLSFTNPFIKNELFQEFVNEKKVVLISIYPSLNIKKNELLFESFKSEYDFSYLYQDFIVNELIEALQKKYRLNKDYKSRTLLGESNSALMSLTCPLDFTSSFGNIVSLNLDLNNIYKKIRCYILSKFDPNINITLSMEDSSKLNELSLLLRDFGIISFKKSNAFTLGDYLTTL